MRLYKSFLLCVCYIMDGIQWSDSRRFNKRLILFLLQGEECEELLLLHLATIQYSSYVITVYFHGLEKVKVTKINFEVSKSSHSVLYTIIFVSEIKSQIG